MQKEIGEFIEKINFAEDPNIFLFYKHILAGLQAFSNPQQPTEDSFAKYKVMLRIAEGFLSAKFGMDFNQIRKEIKQKTADESEQLAMEIQKIAELLDTKVRKVEIMLKFKKDAVELDDAEFEAMTDLLDKD